MSSIAQISQLEPGTLVERELSETARHTYSLSVRADSYVRLAAEQHGVDLELHWIGPDGEELATKDSPTGDRGEERIHSVAERTGEYRVEVSVVSPGYGEGPGRYTLRADVRSPANEDDRRRALSFETAQRATEAVAGGDWEAARELFLAAAERWRDLGETAEEASARLWAGQCLFATRKSSAALEQLEKAESLFQTLDHRAELASTLAHKGRVLRHLDRFHDSLTAYRRAQSLLREIGNPEAEIGAWLGIGNACLWLDRVEEGMQAYEETLAGLESFPDPGTEAAACYGLGQLYEERHDFERARAYYEQTLEAARRNGDDRLANKAQRRWTSVLGKLGDVEEAEAQLQARWMEIRRGKAAGTVEEALVLNALGSLHLDAGAPREALPHFENALEVSRTVQSLPHEAMTLQRLGRVHARLGDLDRAASLHHRAAELFETVPDAQGTVSARYSEARALYELERYEQARDLLEGILDDAETLRAATESHDLRASWVASRRHYWELLVDTLMQLHAASPEKRFDVLALQRSEEARARGLLDQLQEARIDVRRDADPELVRREERIREQLHVVERQRAELLDGDASPETFAELEDHRDRLLQALRKTGRELRTAAREAGNAVLDPSPIRWSRVQSRILDGETQLLSYFVGERRSFVWWASTERDLVTGVLPGREILERRIGHFLDLITNSNSDERKMRLEAMRSLGETLLGPVAGEISARRLIIVPDGALHRVPFAALAVPGSPPDGAPTLLIDDHEIVLEPSISVLDALMHRTAKRDRPADRVVVFADPVFTADDERLGGEAVADPDESSLLRRSSRSLGFELSRLPDSSVEAHAARQRAAERSLKSTLYQGFDAAKSVLDGDLQGIRVLHFATHALMNPEQPELSGIVLSLYDDQGEPQDGFLPLHEIYGLDLDADLVVLSACATGVGRQLRGEGLIGLPRGFFYAGAPRVIHTLWSVNDKSAAELMSRFYEGHLGRGLSAPRALAEAQRSLRATDDWSEPDHWAPFVFQGDWTEPPENPDDPIGKLSMPDPEEEEPPPDDSVPIRMPDEDPGGSSSASAEDPDLLYFNGLDATSGGYWTPPRSPEQLAEDVWKQMEPILPPDDEEDELYDPHRVSLLGIDPRNLSQMGWGVVFPTGVSSRIEQALSPLLELRERQVGNRSRFHKFYVDPEEAAPRWLAHLDAGRGAVLTPEKIPYYLLMVGGPEELSFELQQKLGGTYAVGRIAFDSDDEYREYAQRVVRQARDPGRLPREAVFFSAANEGDRATKRTTWDLVEPLARDLEERQHRFRIRKVLGPEARKSRLLELLNGSEAPAVLFAAGHGLAYPPGHSRQSDRQGALVCSDFSNPFRGQVVPPEAFVSAEDLTAARTPGLISFLFACYGVGTPTWDGFTQTRRTAKDRQAPQPFLSRLPQRLLARPEGSLAVIGHVDRAWTTSFSWEGETSQPDAFRRTLELLFQGQPVGAALDPMRQLWNEVAKESNDLWQKRERGELEPGDDRRFAHYWIANNDAQAYVICGDPAVTVAARGNG